MIEIWSAIINYEGLYEVSNWGSIRSLDKIVKTTYRNQKRKLKGKILGLIKPGLKNNPYYRVSLFKNSIREYFYVHRLVATMFINNPENKPFVNHKDGNKLNNCDWNLEWCTRLENELHAKINGLKTFNPGEEHPNAQLKEIDVIEIIKLHKYKSLGVTKISQKFDKSIYCIEDIVYGRSWKYVNRDEI